MTFEEPKAFIDFKSAAEAGGLRYVSDSIPGITRRHSGKTFHYFTTTGKRIGDARILMRIRKLAIPPAWADVWISPDSDGHLAVTGRDARGRKQYRYNPAFTEQRDAAKYEHVIAFARQLPQLRKQVGHHMAQKGLSREKVLATIVYLLERTHSRIGNESYARDNKSYGLTTLRNGHVRVRGDGLKFRFLGKSGKTWEFAVESRRVAKVIRACQDIPGQHLFEYRDETGEVHAIRSENVNAYLREITGRDVTAKDFRTWIGTVAMAAALQDYADREEKPRKSHINTALKQTAQMLGNTVAVCRKCYVHPHVMESYAQGDFSLVPQRPSRSRFALRPEEKAVLRFLEKYSRKTRKRSA